MKNVADVVLSMYCDTVQEVTGNVEELHTIVDWKFICQIRRTDMQVGGGGYYDEWGQKGDCVPYLIVELYSIL